MSTPGLYVTQEIQLKQGEREQVHRLAKGLWRRTYRRGIFYRLCSRIKGKSFRLKSLWEDRESARTHYTGFRPVLLSRIRGSEGRSGDFDDRFYPLVEHNMERWIGMAEAMLMEVNLPAVVLVKKGEVYFVRDGHHRVSAAKALGFASLDAEVIEYS